MLCTDKYRSNDQPCRLIVVSNQRPSPQRGKHLKTSNAIKKKLKKKQPVPTHLPIMTVWISVHPSAKQISLPATKIATFKQVSAKIWWRTALINGKGEKNPPKITTMKPV